MAATGERYLRALEDLIESRERNRPKFKKLAKLAARQEIGINCARTGQAGACVVAAGLLFTPYAPSIVLTAAAVGVTSMGVSATEGISNWVVGEKLENLTEEDRLLAQIAWEARKAYIEESNPIAASISAGQETLLLTEGTKNEEESENEERKAEKKRKNKKEKNKRNGSYYEVTELQERKRRDKERNEKRERKKNKKVAEDDEHQEEENREKTEEVKPDWWLVPQSLAGPLVQPVKETGDSLKKSTMGVLAKQGLVSVTGKVAGKSAGMVSNAAVSVAHCVSCWQNENKNKVEARQWHLFVGSSLPVLHDELRRLRSDQDLGINDNYTTM